MRVFRICKRRYAATALDGEGARRYAGRWHHRGTPIVYTASSIALAALEMLVHFDTDLAPEGFVTLAVDLPTAARVEVLAEERLPPGWDRFPSPAATRDLGSSWVEAGESLALSVPSVVVPQERNVLLNPAHPHAAELVVSPPEPFSFDPRLLSGRR